MSTALALTLACAVSVALLLAAEWRGSALARAVFKLAASSCFVALAVVLGARQSGYGQWLLAALVLGWLGDALLLSERSGLFIGGLLAFLLSHLSFGAAFVVGGLDGQTLAVSAVPALITAALTARWLWPHLDGVFRTAVPVYVAAILLMCCAAAGHAAPSGRWIVLAGALLFAASDLAVARERFVARGLVNKLWGLPTYFAAQLLLAWSVAHGSASVG